MSWGGSVTSGADVLGAVLFEMGATAARVTGKDSGVGMTTEGARNWGRDGGR